MKLPLFSRIQKIINRNLDIRIIKTYEGATMNKIPDTYFAQHTHGAGGIDALLFNKGDDVRLAKAYQAIGIFAATPTLLTADAATLIRAQEAYLSSSYRGELFWGLFSEGNFGSPNKRGCQNAALMEPLTLEALERLFAPALQEGFPLRVMFAPETVAHLEGTMKSILGKYGSVSLVIGHTDATLEKAMEALRYGAEGFVHFGNAMSGSIAQRDPINPEQIKAISQKYDSELGVKDMLFKFDCQRLMDNTGGLGAYFEVILDGIHVHPEFFLYMVKQFSSDLVVPVTDQMVGTGMGIGYKFDVSGSTAVVSEPSKKNPYRGYPGQKMLLAVMEGTDTIAGSLATDAQLATNALHWLTGDYAKRSDLGLNPMSSEDVQEVVDELFSNSESIHMPDL